MPEIPAVPTLWRFPAQPASVGRARHLVGEALPKGLRPYLADDLRLLASELVTNAIRHGAGLGEEELVELVLWPADGHYWLAVSDSGAGCRTPALACPNTSTESGRGLILVDRLTAAWTVRPRPVRGTSVIAGLPLCEDG